MRSLLPLILALAGTGCREGKSQSAAAIPVVLRVDDTTPWHVHAPGKPLRVQVTATPARPTRARLLAVWVDAEGTPLAAPILLPHGRRKTLTAPTKAAGYCGLVVRSDQPEIAFPPQAPGFASEEFGFAILPPPGDRRQPDRRFGMVHADVLVKGQTWDPYLRGHQIKTMTWDMEVAAWRHALRERQEAGLEELPIVADTGWDVDGKKPITARELKAFETRFRALTKASPLPAALEFGVEENLGGRFDREPHYLANLAAKLGRVRKSSRRQFVYNLEGFEYEDHEALLRHPAGAHIDVLSSHPYRWPDFPDPETWLPAHVQRLRELTTAAGRARMSIWFTEIGIPVRGNRDPKGFFGYPEDGNQVPGATRAGAARYLVCSNLLALAHGVERVFAYNYQNRGDDRRLAEDHFGLRSFVAEPDTPGFPLPGYVAYATMTDLLHRRPFVAQHRPTTARDQELWCLEFQGVLVVWSRFAKPTEVRYGQLKTGLTRSGVRRAVDLFHAERFLPPNSLRIGRKPVYLLLKDR